MDDNFAAELQSLLTKYGYAAGFPATVESISPPPTVTSQEPMPQTATPQTVTFPNPTPQTETIQAPAPQTATTQTAAPIGSTDLSLQQQVFDLVSKGLEYVSTKPPESVDPITEFLDRPDGPLSRYAIKNTSKGAN